MSSSLLGRRQVLMGGFAALALGACSKQKPQDTGVSSGAQNMQAAKPPVKICAAPLETRNRVVYQAPIPPVAGAPLNGLKRGNQDFIDTNRGSYRLVYFGTAQRLSSCGVDLARIRDTIAALPASCNGTMPDITPVFIYPDPRPQDAPFLNLSEIAEAPDSKFLSLHGPFETVAALGEKFSMMYLTAPDGTIQSHTRYAYLMSPEGKNIFTFNADIFPPFIIPEILEQMGLRRDPSAAPAPGVT